ncbi:MAG: hypothetical protein CM1200mP18_22350 [Gammaproteobacteria bacterium]|nr:MAG: hypothetical protein CM1200mP18_22350 [Gammaproteobacteria bacterium]
MRRLEKQWKTFPCCLGSGQRLEQVCRVVVYLTDIRYRESVYQEMGKWFKGVHPCSTGLVVSALARPEWLVEIEVTAVIPHAPAT